MWSPSEPCCSRSHAYDWPRTPLIWVLTLTYRLGSAGSTLTCLLTMGWPGDLHSSLTLATVTRPALPPSFPYCGGAPLAGKATTSCLPCHGSQVLDCLPLSTFTAPLHAPVKLHLSPCSVSIFFATNPENIHLYKKHKKKWSKILQELSTSQLIPFHLRKG